MGHTLSISLLCVELESCKAVMRIQTRLVNILSCFHAQAIPAKIVSWAFTTGEVLGSLVCLAAVGGARIVGK